MDNLQQIAIDRIVPSPEPVRSHWDEDKMAELVDSVAENGIIVPVKLRPVEDGKMEIVYGHRRVEAARRVGFEAVPAVVEMLDSLDALVQAFLENKQRDDITPAEEGEVFEHMHRDYDLTYEEVGVRCGLKKAWVIMCSGLVKDADMRPLLVARATDSAHKAKWIKSAVKDSNTRRAIAQKVVDENLTSRQTEQLSKAIAKTPHEQARNMLLNMPFSPSKLMSEIGDVATTDKFSPEARQFVAERLRKFRAEIDRTISQLEA